MNPPLTVSQLHNLPNETWVNDGFTGLVKDIDRRMSSKTGKPYFKVTIGEQQGTLTVGCTMFTMPKFGEGSLIEVTGKGIKYKDGQYGKEVSFGDKANIAILGTSARPSDQPPYQAPVSAVATAQPHTRTETEAINPVFGATVGMAMNQAIQVLTQNLEHDELVERIIRPDFWYSVHEVASDVIRVARELERGRLAPSPTERSKRAGGLRNASPAHPDSHPDFEPAQPEPLPF